MGLAKDVKVYEIKYYEPKPYYGCPRCGGNLYGAINPAQAGEPYIYRCHGFSLGGVELPGCETLFTIPPATIEQMKKEDSTAGYTTKDLDN